MSPRSRSAPASTEPSQLGSGDVVLRCVLDDDTINLLKEEAAKRELPLGNLIAALLKAASTRCADLLDGP